MEEKCAATTQTSFFFSWHNHKKYREKNVDVSTNQVNFSSNSDH